MKRETRAEIQTGLDWLGRERGAYFHTINAYLHFLAASKAEKIAKPLLILLRFFGLISLNKLLIGFMVNQEQLKFLN